MSLKDHKKITNYKTVSGVKEDYPAYLSVFVDSRYFLSIFAKIPFYRWWSWTGSNRLPPACKAYHLNQVSQEIKHISRNITKRSQNLFSGHPAFSVS